jgi:hypothetical protein
MRGLMIAGAPPVGRTKMAEGFITSPQRGLATRGLLSESEIDEFVRVIFGQLRKRVFEAARAGEGVDQRLLAETSPCLSLISSAAPCARQVGSAPSFNPSPSGRAPKNLQRVWTQSLNQSDIRRGTGLRSGQEARS